jgi:hypothetical protein
MHGNGVRRRVVGAGVDGGEEDMITRIDGLCRRIIHRLERGGGLVVTMIMAVAGDDIPDLGVRHHRVRRLDHARLTLR